MEQSEKNRIVATLTQRHHSIASSHQRNALVSLDRDTMLDLLDLLELLELVVELEHARRMTRKATTG